MSLKNIYIILLCMRQILLNNLNTFQVYLRGRGKTRKKKKKPENQEDNHSKVISYSLGVVKDDEKIS